MMNERVNREKEIYNKGIDRRKYNDYFGHAQEGIANIEARRVMQDHIAEGGSDAYILELGGHGWSKFCDWKNRPPHKLTCINISERELQKGISKAKELETRNYCIHEFRIMDAHNLEFEDNTFDVIFGDGILHHLDFEQAIKEIYRVLKPNGKIVFFEPLGRNPVGKFVRRKTPTVRTKDEKPLDIEEFRILKKYFNLNCTYFQFLYVVAGALSKYFFHSADNWLMNSVYKVDCKLAKILQHTNFVLWYRYVVIYGKEISYIS